MRNDKAQGEIGTLEPHSVLTVKYLIMLFWRKRRKLIIVGILGTVVFLGLTFLETSTYDSTAQLMPPDDSAFSGRPSISAALLSPSAAEEMFSSESAEEYISGRTVGGTLIGVLSSRTALQDIVNRLNLRSVYQCSLNEQARKKLLNSTTFKEDKKSGLIAITVTDENPYRARDIAQAYVDELTKLASGLSSSSAHQEREFLDGRVAAVREDLDSDSKALGEFSSHNATMDPEKQGEATLEADEKLEGELAAAESQLSGLTAMYTDNNVQVRAARNRVNALQKQLVATTGTQQNASRRPSSADQGLPSVRQLPLLGLNYYQLYRQVQMEQQLYDALSKEDEAAKLEEAEEIVPIKVLDAPVIAERRNSKHRAKFMLIGMLFFLLVESTWIVARELWMSTDDSHPVKALFIALLHLRRRQTAMGTR